MYVRTRLRGMTVETPRRRVVVRVPPRLAAEVRAAWETDLAAVGVFDGYVTDQVVRADVECLKLRSQSRRLLHQICTCDKSKEFIRLQLVIWTSPVRVKFGGICLPPTCCCIVGVFCVDPVALPTEAVPCALRTYLIVRSSDALCVSDQTEMFAKQVGADKALCESLQF